MDGCVGCVYVCAYMFAYKQKILFYLSKDIVSDATICVNASDAYPDIVSDLFDGDRCCAHPNNTLMPETCGVLWNSTGPVEVVAYFSKPLWVNEISFFPFF